MWYTLSHLEVKRQSGIRLVGWRSRRLGGRARLLVSESATWDLGLEGLATSAMAATAALSDRLSDQRLALFSLQVVLITRTFDANSGIHAGAKLFTHFGDGDMGCEAC
ncbi:hypothetical protein [Micromonospora sp. NPDC048839]|uniref:hypothetical protein n=1 Tax=Micromonospora sp. NPDC048839 TaxID=3155641 RepID=UPI0033C5E784